MCCYFRMKCSCCKKRSRSVVSDIALQEESAPSNVQMRILPAPPSSTSAKEAVMTEVVDLYEFLHGEEMITANTFLKDEDFVTLRQFLDEEKEENPAWRARPKKQLSPIRECITLTDLTESPSATRKASSARRARKNPFSRKHATLSNLSLPVPICDDQEPSGKGRPPMIKQRSAPLLKYLPPPPGLYYDQEAAAAAEKKGTVPPPPSPQEVRKEEAKKAKAAKPKKKLGLLYEHAV